MSDSPSAPVPAGAAGAGPAGTAGPSPSLFFQTVNAYQRTAVIKAAVELDLFTAIGEGKATPADLAPRVKAAERGVRILCDHLVLMGFLTKQGGRYGLTADSAAFLDRRSAAYAGGVVDFLLSPPIKSNFDDLAAVVRKGGTVAQSQGTLSPEHPVWVQFARSMGAAMALPAQLLADLILGPGAPPAGPAGAGGKLKVLDIAAGHGLYGLAFARKDPAAEVTALDWPNVLEVAKENARSAGVEGRFRTIAGSAFDVEFGGPYDLVLLPNFLHHFDPATCEKLLAKTRAALAAGGRAVAVEFVPDEDRVTPPDAAGFALTMLATTPSGDAYTFAEYRAMFRNAGFSRSELRPLPPTMERVVIGYR